MEYKICQIKDLSDRSLTDILANSITADMFDRPELEENYLYKYRNNPSNLFCILEKGRYINGSYFIVLDKNNRYLASAGWNPYNNSTALLLTRMLVVPELRGSYILARTVLQKMIDQSSNFENRWISFNEYNLTLYRWFDRVANGKRGALFNDWPKIYSRFRPIGQREINHTLQWVVELQNK